MRRAIAPVLLVLSVWSAPLGAQSAFSIGFAGTLGSSWQIEAVEAGLVRHTGLGPVRYVSASARLGWFGDQAAIIGGTRGFIGAAALAVRSGRLGLFDVGQDANPTVIALDLTLEVAGYLAARSPIPEGKRWVSVAALPALRMGQAGGSQFAILVGPAWFAGDVRRTHAFLGARVEVPLAHGRGAP